LLLHFLQASNLNYVEDVKQNYSDSDQTYSTHPDQPYSNQDVLSPEAAYENEDEDDWDDSSSVTTTATVQVLYHTTPCCTINCKDEASITMI